MTAVLIRDNMSSVLVEPAVRSDHNQTDAQIWRMFLEGNVGAGSEYSSPVLAILYFTFLVSVILVSVLAAYWRKRGETSDSAPPSYAKVVFAEPPPPYDEIINVYLENSLETTDLIVL